MQDYAEQSKLLKQIDDGLADIQKDEEALAALRMSLSNQAKRFRISRSAVTNTSLVAFSQRLGKLEGAYQTQAGRVYELMRVVDKIRP